MNFLRTTLVSIHRKIILFITLFMVVFFPYGISKSEVLENIDILTSEWKPYTSQNMEGYGLASEIVSRVLLRMGYKAKFSFMSFNQAYETVYESDTNKEARGTFPFYKSAFIDANGKVRYREKEMYFSHALTSIETSNLIFYNTHQKKITDKLKNAKNVDDLDGCKLVVVKGYAYPSDVIKIVNWEQVDTESDAFKKLFDTSEPYIVIAEEKVGDQILKEQFSKNKDIIEKVTAEGLRFKENIHFVVSRRNPNNLLFINDFNKNLDDLKTEGVIQELEEKKKKRQTVLLKGFGTSRMPSGKKNREGNSEYMLPRGTQAVVIRWGGEFDPDNEEYRKVTYVEIKNGPMTGEKLYIKNEFITLP